VYVEEKNGNDGHCDERSGPADYEHNEYTDHGSHQTQPHRIELERRPPAYSKQENFDSCITIPHTDTLLATKKKHKFLFRWQKYKHIHQSY